MNKLGISLLLAAGLFGLDVSPVAAHPQADRVQVHSDGYRFNARRHDAMPRWLSRDKRFRHWYRHSPLKRYRRLGWNELYDIYRWERRYFGSRKHYDRNDRRNYRDGNRRRYRDD